MVFRLSIVTRVLLFAGVIMFVPMPFGLFRQGEDTLAIFGGIPIALLALFTFISSLYKVELMDTEIRVTKYLQSSALQWHEIANISLKNDGYGFYLNNADSTVQLFISNQVIDFKELVTQIERKRPDLFR